MANMTDYLLELAADPDRAARFKADPASELGAIELSEREKDALASCDAQKIAQELSESSPQTDVVLQWLFSLSQESDD